MSPPVLLAGVGGVLALIAFLFAESRSPNPMMPLRMFSSRQFSGANLVTFVVYAALGGFFFLFVSFLQITMGYSPIAAGAASLLLAVAVLPAIAGLTGDNFYDPAKMSDGFDTRTGDLPRCAPC